MAPGSWGVELWDQFDVVLKYSSDEISSTDTLFRLLSEIQKLQHDFGKKLRKTVATYTLKKKVVSEDTTYNTSMVNLIQNLGNVGSLYEKGAKDLGDCVIGGMKELYDNERKQLDTHRSSYTKLNSSLEQHRKQLDAAWQKYVLAYKEKQKAYDFSKKVDADENLPRAEQVKARKAYEDKSRLFDQIQGEYAEELSTYNSNLRQHYNKNAVQLLEDIQLKNQDRTNRTKDLLVKMCDVRDDLSNKMLEINRLTRDAIMEMDPLKDNEFVIKRHKSGELPPVDLPFLDLARCQPALFDGPIHPMGAYLLGLDPSQPCSQLSASGITTGGSTAGGGGMLGGLKLGKGTKENYANLSNPFICDISTRGVKDVDLTVLQLTERIRDLTDCVQKANAEIQGTQRLLEAYRNNPALGSSKTVEPKIEILNSRIQSLQDLMKRLEDRYAKVGGDQALSEARRRQTALQGDSMDSGRVSANSKALVGNFESEDSLDSDVEDAGIPSKGSGTANIPPAPSLASGEPTAPSYVGLATALYEYAGSGTSYLATHPGERFRVVQLDTDNTGWTSVVSEDGSKEGFVPTSFMNIQTY